jgi:hypothetical protein
VGVRKECQAARAIPRWPSSKKLPIFSGLGEKQLRMMAANLDSVTVKEGELVMTAGRRNDAF